MMTEQPKTAGVIAPPPVLYISSLLLAFGVNVFAPGSIALPPLMLYIAGAIFLVFSGFFARWAFVEMKKSGTSANPRESSEVLITEGPFKHSRNPIYVAMTGLYIGITLIGNSWWPLLFVIPLMVIMHWGVVRREEHYLAQRFGDVYLVYKSKTRRWL